MTVNVRAAKLDGVIERRALALDTFEIRKTGDTLKFEGYASLFNSPYDMYGGPDKGGWVETVNPGAFDRTLKAKPDVVLLINHEGMPLARTTSGTMRLSTDAKGLLAAAELDLRDPEVQSLHVKMGRGDINQMSFAFRAVAAPMNDEQTQRTMVELSLDRGDVSIVTNGANPATTASLRSIGDILAAFEEIDPTVALAEMRAAHDNPVVALEAAHKIIGTLLANASGSAGVRRLSVAHAERLAMLDA